MSASTTTHAAIGLDIGGTGMKAALVSMRSGERLSERRRVPTPPGGEPERVVDTAVELLGRVRRDAAPHSDDPDGLPLGVCLPAVVRRGVARSAANISEAWIGLDAGARFAEALGRPVSLVNDADAAGYAEVRFGAGREERGTIMMITLGTGIGSALFHDHRLLPNTELGHLDIVPYEDFERFASAKARKRLGIELDEWATEWLTPYFRRLERLFSPDLFIVAGGIIKRAEQFLPLVEAEAPVVPARLLNDSGIAGAALLGAEGWR